jgi:hypothetical protein
LLSISPASTTSDMGHGEKNSRRSAVGTVITDRPPPRSVRAGFPHTAPDTDDGLGIQSAASLCIRCHEKAFWLRRRQRAQPNTLHIVVECFQRSSVSRHCVVGEEASDDLLDPSPLLRDWLMHPPSQLVLDFPKRCLACDRAAVSSSRGTAHGCCVHR